MAHSITAHPRRLSARPAGRTGRLANRIVGGGFAVAAAGNALGTLPAAREFLEWCRDSAWLAPYPWALGQLVSVASGVVLAAVVFEAGVAALLWSNAHERLGLGLATAWVIGLIPALAWPYWSVNVGLAIGFAVLLRRSQPSPRSAKE